MFGMGSYQDVVVGMLNMRDLNVLLNMMDYCTGDAAFVSFRYDSMEEAAQEKTHLLSPSLCRRSSSREDAQSQPPRHQHLV